jgi:hypothetical protein
MTMKWWYITAVKSFITLAPVFKRISFSLFIFISFLSKLFALSLTSEFLEAEPTSLFLSSFEPETNKAYKVTHEVKLLVP